MDQLTNNINHLFGSISRGLSSILNFEYHDYVTQFLTIYSHIHAWEWGIVFFLIVTSMMALRKLGSHFLKNIMQLPFFIQLQKWCFQFIEGVAILCLWGAMIGYIGFLILATFQLKSLVALALLIWAILPGAIIGGLIGGFVGRLLQQLIAKRVETKYSKMIQTKKDANVEGQSDIRDVAAELESSRDYDPTKFFKNAHIFLARDEYDKPIYLPLKKFCKQHIQIMGSTGSGKSVMAINTLSQCLKEGISCVMFDPKKGADEWAPHVLKKMCDQYGKKLILLNLEGDVPQINLLKDIDQRNLNELLQPGMGIGDKGGDSDYYRLKDRKAAHRAATLAGSIKSFSHLYYVMWQKFEAYMEKAETFADKLEALAFIAVAQTEEGIDLKDMLDNGHCLYIVGSMRDESIKLLQRMVLLRIMQIIEDRDRLEEHRHVTMFIDELKYFLTRPVLDALSTVRDHGCNMLLGHQGPDDLLDVPKDIDGRVCKKTVFTNTNIKLMYKLNDDDDQKKGAALTGDKNVLRQSMRQHTNMGVAEVTDTDERQLMTTQEALYSRNYFALMSERVGVIVGVGLARLCFTSPIIVEKSPLEFKAYPRGIDYMAMLHADKDVSSFEASKHKPVNANVTPDHHNETTSPPVDPFDELHTMNELEQAEQHDILEDIR